MSKLKKLPKFKSEDQEREFWATHSLTDYFDMSKAIVNPKFPNLKPSTRTVTLRMPQEMYENLKQLANRIDVPYQSYMKIMLADKIREIKLSDKGIKSYQVGKPPQKTKKSKS